MFLFVVAYRSSSLRSSSSLAGSFADYWISSVSSLVRNNRR